MDKSALTQMYIDYITAEGFQHTFNSTGDIAFKLDDEWVLICIDEDDQEFFRLLKPDIWPINSDEEMSRAFAASYKITANGKVA